MALSNLGVSALSQLLKEFSPERFETSMANTSVLLADQSILKQEDCEGEELIVLCTVPGQHSTTWIADFDNRPRGGANAPVKGRVLPAQVQSVMSMGSAARLGVLDVEGISGLLDHALEQHTADVARHVARGLYGSTVSPSSGATWSGTGADATVTVAFADISLFKPGAAYDFIDVSSTPDDGFVVRCTNVVPTGFVGGNVSFINDIPNDAGVVPSLVNTTVATGDIFALRGTYSRGADAQDSGDSINSFDDIAGAGHNSSFMGINPANLGGWVGRQFTASTTYSQEYVLAALSSIKSLSGQYPTHVIMGPHLYAAHCAAAGVQGAVFGFSGGNSAAAVRDVTSSLNRYEGFSDTGLRVGMAKLVQDDNCPAAEIVLHNSKFAKLAVWKKVGPDEEAGDPVLLNRSTNNIDVYFSGMMNLYCSNRSAIGVIKSFTLS